MPPSFLGFMWCTSRVSLFSRGFSQTGQIPFCLVSKLLAFLLNSIECLANPLVLFLKYSLLSRLYEFKGEHIVCLLISIQPICISVIGCPLVSSHWKTQLLPPRAMKYLFLSLRFGIFGCLRHNIFHSSVQTYLPRELKTFLEVAVL